MLSRLYPKLSPRLAVSLWFFFPQEGPTELLPCLSVSRPTDIFETWSKTRESIKEIEKHYLYYLWRLEEGESVRVETLRLAGRMNDYQRVKRLMRDEELKHCLQHSLVPTADIIFIDMLFSDNVKMISWFRKKADPYFYKNKHRRRLPSMESYPSWMLKRDREYFSHYDSKVPILLHVNRLIKGLAYVGCRDAIRYIIRSGEVTPVTPSDLAGYGCLFYSIREWSLLSDLITTREQLKNRNVLKPASEDNNFYEDDITSELVDLLNPSPVKSREEMIKWCIDTISDSFTKYSWRPVENYLCKMLNVGDDFLFGYTLEVLRKSGRLYKMFRFGRLIKYVNSEKRIDMLLNYINTEEKWTKEFHIRRRRNYRIVSTLYNFISCREEEPKLILYLLEKAPYLRDKFLPTCSADWKTLRTLIETGMFSKKEVLYGVCTTRSSTYYAKRVLYPWFARGLKLEWSRELESEFILRCRRGDYRFASKMARIMLPDKSSLVRGLVESIPSSIQLTKFLNELYQKHYGDISPFLQKYAERIESAKERLNEASRKRLDELLKPTKQNDNPLVTVYIPVHSRWCRRRYRAVEAYLRPPDHL